MAAVCLLGLLVLQSFNSPECVLQVIASGQWNGAEEPLNSGNCVQEQRLWEVLWRDRTQQIISHAWHKEKKSYTGNTLYCRCWLHRGMAKCGKSLVAAQIEMNFSKLCLESDRRRVLLLYYLLRQRHLSQEMSVFKFVLLKKILYKMQGLCHISKMMLSQKVYAYWDL